MYRYSITLPIESIRFVPLTASLTESTDAIAFLFLCRIPNLSATGSGTRLGLHELTRPLSRKGEKKNKENTRAVFGHASVSRVGDARRRFPITLPSTLYRSRQVILFFARVRATFCQPYLSRSLHLPSIIRARLDSEQTRSEMLRCPFPAVLNVAI